MNNKKKIIIICSMVVLLIAAGYLNVLLNKNDTDPVNNPEDPVVSVSFFSAYRSVRDTSRAQEFTYLDAIIASSSTTEEAKTTAENMQLDMIEVMEMEMVLEGLIKAKGYEEAVVTISTNNIYVIAQDDNLVNEDIAQILYVITSETGYSPSKVVILSYDQLNA